MFEEKDLQMWNKFVSMILNIKDLGFGTRDSMEFNKCLAWANTVSKKIEDNIMELKAIHKAPDSTPTAEG